MPSQELLAAWSEILELPEKTIGNCLFHCKKFSRSRGRSPLLNEIGIMDAEDLFGEFMGYLLEKKERGCVMRSGSMHFRLIDYLRERTGIRTKSRRPPIGMATRSIYMRANTVKSDGRELMIIDDLKASTTQEHLSNMQYDQAMCRIKSALSDREFTVFCRYILQEDTLKEISNYLGMSESRICQIYHGLMKRIRLIKWSKYGWKEEEQSGREAG